MKVSELIKELSKFPPDTIVGVNAPYEDFDKGWTNAGGDIAGVRVRTPRKWDCAPEVEIFLDADFPSLFDEEGDEIKA